MSGPFTACPNGRHDEGYAHDFASYQPGLDNHERRPLMFCERCGEVRALALPPTETAPESTAALESAVFGDLNRYYRPPTED